jgi:ELWxxDGT repeat protein
VRTKRRSLAALTPMALVICGCVPAPSLLKDLETGPVGSYPANVTPATGGFYFSATASTLGTELGFYDGSQPRLVADLGPDTSSGYPSGIFTNGLRAFFRADDGTDGDASTTTYSVFVTDGTADTTVRLTPPISQIASDVFNGFGTWGSNGVLFTMNDPKLGLEIFRSDGTVQGTVNVADINTKGSSSPSEMTAFGGHYYFAASDSSLDRELWRTDGTTATRVLDLNPTGSSQPRGLAVWNGKLYFGADQTPNFRRGLFASDGTAAGTVLVTDRSDDLFRPETLTATPSKLFFLAYDTELWITNGTAAGTSAVYTFAADSEGNVPADFVAIGNRVVFHVPTDAGLEVWGSDGTPAGTVQLATNVDTGTDHFAVLSGQYYFTQGDAILRTDGTVAGTTEVYTQTGLAPRSLAAALGKLWFGGSDSAHGNELWSSDGTAGGTAFAVAMNPATNGSYPSSYVRAGSYTFFTATTQAQGRELFCSDGTSAGTILVKDINPGTASSNPGQMKAWNGILYFTADDGSHGVELWRSDCTPAGTYLVKDIRAGATGSTPGDVYPGPNYVYFYADDGTNGAELWRSDGTSAGTVLVKDIYAGSTASTPRFFATLGSNVCFVATTAAEGRELWCSDGTAAGTALVKDIRSGTSTSGIDEPPVALGGYLYFGANDGTSGDELWRTNGTSGGTTRVADINSGSGSASPTRFAVMNGGVFFVASNGTRWEMWRSDGATTNMITGAINPGSYSNPGSLTPVGSTLFFIANDPTVGVELFSTDGTAAGTHLVKDVNPKSGGSSNIQYLTAVSDRLFFSATDGSTGTELWISDGTTAGTQVSTGSDGDTHSSFPSALAESGGMLYVTLDDPTYGQEPFTCPPH